MHYGGSTLDMMPKAILDCARAINRLDDLGARRGGLTPYQLTIRFWCIARVRRWQFQPTKEVHHAP